MKVSIETEQVKIAHLEMSLTELDWLKSLISNLICFPTYVNHQIADDVRPFRKFYKELNT